VLAIFLLPYTVLLNSVIFEERYFSDWKIFAFTTLVTAGSFMIYFVLCGFVALLMKRRFPEENRVTVKLAFMIITFLLMTGLYLYSLFLFYESVTFLGYVFNEHSFVWAYIGQSIMNIFLTFLMEGIARYEIWKTNLEETYQLKQSYNQSKLQGLKSQVNPHFLFNSLNSLSSLISEDEEDAEKFLNEMSKVYRYMLRTEENELVTLHTELQFLESFHYLLKARYGENLILTVYVNEKDMEKYLPPLTLQVLIENAFMQNAISKKNPLRITVRSTGDNHIIVHNNVQPKLVTESMDFETGLDNLVTKYRLLVNRHLSIEENAEERIIKIPLITAREEVMV
jgi:LytS/YehU family sensor histidine kinase